VAAVGGKHYVLQQQAQLGQQLAKAGKTSAVQQLTDSQQQAIADGIAKQDYNEEPFGSDSE